MTSTIKNQLEIVALWTLLFIPSLRTCLKYLPAPAVVVPVAGILFYFFAWAVIRTRLVDRITSRVATGHICLGMFVLLFCAANFIVYPIADARKAQGLGSTADDAIIQPVRQMLTTDKPYDVELYGNAPVSPGPGWMLLHTPLVLLHSYAFLTPLYLLLVLEVFVAWYKNDTPWWLSRYCWLPLRCSGS